MDEFKYNIGDTVSITYNGDIFIIKGRFIENATGKKVYKLINDINQVIYWYEEGLLPVDEIDYDLEEISVLYM